MPLPSINLDDRRFQDLVDQAKRMIPQYCPEWTDHNVSDPGVTLIELFAWMTELLLYRVNQVPAKMQLQFLELLGMRLAPPRAAQAPVTFYLSAPQQLDRLIPAGTELATVRTETSPAIIFTTEQDLTLRPPQVRGAFTRPVGRNAAWITHDLRQLSLTERSINLFPAQLAPGDAFYLAFEEDHGNHLLALVVNCTTAGGAGIDPNNPPVQWQVWQGATSGRWADCELEYDGTGGFNRNGEIILHLPRMVNEELQGVSGYWLRCRLTEAQGGPNSYRASPAITDLRVETRGGTALARHAVSVHNERLGLSDGSPGQRFTLLQRPVLNRDPARDYLVVVPPGGEAEQWEEVEDFADSHADSNHYTLDSIDGSLTLGPALLQPDGTVYRFGKVPVKGSELRFSHYQHGGGVVGNLPRGALSVLKTSMPYVARVSNRAPAAGGIDAQTLDDARLRVPQVLRTRQRAVTADDFEFLATQVHGVARACCLAPGAQPGEAYDIAPGRVVVLLVPHLDAPHGAIRPDQLILSTELLRSVQNHLNDRCLIGTSPEVRMPQYIWISVEARLRVRPRSAPALEAEVYRLADAALYRYLNPLVGGADGTGWIFGRDLHVSEIFALMQRIPNVEFVDEVRVTVREPGRSEGGQPVLGRLDVPDGALVCSYQHRVEVLQLTTL
ncbi:putative baseplate assembly protein [Candidatus Viridilinea mediisalina]|uniref:Putative baseplate assembly protein n=1 Tax=Candidatus Viridilinea mediisalina TaxID=2024553 RepID=A0A2A6RIK9_9CHLR|nr:putative baseplate assembly protein [Candidatus Viridilinea mediisalina]PDW02680.1 putative baseplate assembly protein [Candidatus Viridilinea mediisalina]